MSYSKYGYPYSGPSVTCSLASTQLFVPCASLSATSSSIASCCDSASTPAAAAAANVDTTTNMYSSGLLAYPRVASLSDSMYPSAYAPTAQGYVSFGSESSAFYSPLTSDSGDAWRNFSQSASGWPYDPSNMSAYHYGSGYGGLDVRRKNATRESTSTLKAWLYEHIKNPYPTKGEKIMLAIITKMTLTQVSTWFANARRRLKKENKMQWSPRNRTDNDDDDKTSSDDDDDNSKDGSSGRSKKTGSSKDDDEDIVVDNAGSEDQLFSSSDCSLPDVAAHGPCRQDPSTDVEDTRVLANATDVNPALLVGRPGFLAPCAAYSNSFYLSQCSVAKASLGPGGVRQPPPGSFCRTTVDDLQGDHPENKPRIWSLADVATSRGSARRQSNGDQSPVTGQGGGAGGVVGMCAGMGPSSAPMGQSFQPWANGGVGGGAYCDDVATSYPVTPYNTMTSFPLGLTHQGAMANGSSSNHLEGDVGAGGNQMGVLGNHMRSPRDHQMALQYQTSGINGYSDDSQSELDDIQVSPNTGSYDVTNYASNSTTTINHTAFKPFPKRV